MKKLFGILLGFAFLTTFTANALVKAVDLQCEYLDDPLGIDETVPRMSGSWNRRRTTRNKPLIASSSRQMKR